MIRLEPLTPRVGSLEPGKDADLLVLDGDPLDPRTRIERVYVEGRSVLDAPEGASRSGISQPRASR